MCKNENTAFCLIKYAKNIWEINKVLGIRIESIYKTRTRDKLSMRALPFFYLTLESCLYYNSVLVSRASYTKLTKKPKMHLIRQLDLVHVKCDV